MFQPPSFGPVPADYRLGVGDELVIHAWGEVDFQLTRVVDRDGCIILPRTGKVVCAGRTLAQTEATIRGQLAQSHASINAGSGGTQVEVTLGQLRPIRVYVIGEAARPGSYQLSSASTVLTALYAAGGPAATGSFRDIRLMRGSEVIARLDLYDYLANGERTGDHLLQEGDTVFIPDRQRRVQVTGPVRRPMHYEMTAGENLADLLAYAGGLTPQAVPDLVHIRRVLAAADRKAGQPDQVFLDVPLAPGSPPVALQDGDQVVVDSITARLDRYVDVLGGVKVPGRYEFNEGLIGGRPGGDGRRPVARRHDRPGGDRPHQPRRRPVLGDGAAGRNAGRPPAAGAAAGPRRAAGVHALGVAARARRCTSPARSTNRFRPSGAKA